jgi:PRTRC genetic system ThiF family protein
LHLARLAYHAQGKDVRLSFCDPDVVEEKNIGRQNFAPAEIGRNKAVALTRRYSTAFGLRIQCRPQKFQSDFITAKRHQFTLVVGAVDNAAARKAIHEAIVDSSRLVWWLDCGNHEASGQVLLGNTTNSKLPSIEAGHCLDLPLPTVQHPELLVPDQPATEAESCAELTIRDAQSLMINQAVATYAAQYVYRLVMSHDLDIYATYLDLMAGSARSIGITT